ncbi:hypothetical protein [Haloarcula montana]|nr:hypothetical protein [Haloarcula sp. GH36]
MDERRHPWEKNLAVVTVLPLVGVGGTGKIRMSQSPTRFSRR